MFWDTMSVAEGYSVIKPLFFYILGVVAYAIFVFKFYKFLARKDIFELDLEQYNTSNHPGIKKFFSSFIYAFKYVFLMPLCTFFWFGILTVLLTFLAKEEPLETILLISIAVVAAVRITAYYNEDLSNDLAKMLPFALLGIFLVNTSYFSFGDTWTALQQIPTHLKTIAYYLVFTIALEFFLRLGYFIFGSFGRRSNSKR